jgi:hypothetical protein
MRQRSIGDHRIRFGAAPIAGRPIDLDLHGMFRVVIQLIECGLQQADNRVTADEDVIVHRRRNRRAGPSAIVGRRIEARLPTRCRFALSCRIKFVQHEIVIVDRLSGCSRFVTIKSRDIFDLPKLIENDIPVQELRDHISPSSAHAKRVNERAGDDERGISAAECAWCAGRFRTTRGIERRPHPA